MNEWALISRPIRRARSRKRRLQQKVMFLGVENFIVDTIGTFTVVKGGPRCVARAATQPRRAVSKAREAHRSAK